MRARKFEKKEGSPGADREEGLSLGGEGERKKTNNPRHFISPNNYLYYLHAANAVDSSAARKRLPLTIGHSWTFQNGASNMADVRLQCSVQVSRAAVIFWVTEKRRGRFLVTLCSDCLETRCSL